MGQLDDLLERDDHVDVTDSIEVRAKGKIWYCHCGADMWGYFEDKVKKCPECKRGNVDREWEEREPPKTDQGQMTLEGF